MIAVASGSITNVRDSWMKKHECGARWGKQAKFYCSVRNCEQIAEHFINTVGPLKDQVNSNTRRTEDLEKEDAYTGEQGNL